MIVLITGAAIGIGADVTRKFIQNGHYVIAIGRHDDGLDALRKELSQNVIPLILDDPTCRSSIRNALATLSKDLENIDILINNATLSLGTQQLAHQASLEDWEAMINANCKGLVAMTREVLPRMLARRTGTILNLSSAKEQEPSQGSNVYGATVAFVHQYTLSLIETLVGTGVRATCIAPNNQGKSELLNVLLKDSDRHVSRQKEMDLIPTSADIVDTIYSIATLPPHVNINHMELAQTGELFSPLTIIKPN
jgi:3-hydroxy acid dehydrogenase / malonic semialdehyde reductase